MNTSFIVNEQSAIGISSATCEVSVAWNEGTDAGDSCWVRKIDGESTRPDKRPHLTIYPLLPNPHTFKITKTMCSIEESDNNS